MNIAATSSKIQKGEALLRSVNAIVAAAAADTPLIRPPRRESSKRTYSSNDKCYIVPAVFSSSSSPLQPQAPTLIFTPIDIPLKRPGRRESYDDNDNYDSVAAVVLASSP
jgi:hypothetical protein